MRILIVEDEKPVAAFLQKGFVAEHYEADAVQGGRQAQTLLVGHHYDLVILDLNLPEVDGLEVLRFVRSRDRDLPVLALTSRREVEERVKALDLGADDYLPKPFAFSELSARVRALLRRSGAPADLILRVEDLEFNRVQRQVKRGARTIELTPKELALLDFLMQNAGQCVTRAMILEHVWKLTVDTMTNVVDVYINYLRKKIDEGFDVPLIHTLRGTGYWLGKKEAALQAEEATAGRSEQEATNIRHKALPA